MTRPAVERLEQRCLLAAEFGPIVQDGTLFLFLDGENDQVSFGLPDAETARLTLNGAVFDYAQSDVRFLLFTGGAGDDQIEVAPGVTIAAALDGEDGNDHLVGGAAEDLLEGGLGNDTMLGSAGDDVIDAIDRFLCFYDSFGNEICGPPPASQSQDSVDAGDGDDFVMGDATNDTLDGGAGDNDIDTSQGDSNCVQVSMSYSAVEPVSQADTVLFTFPDPSTARVTVNGNAYDFEQGQVVCFMADAEQGDDSIQMDASVTVPATLWGGDGNDTLAGGSGADSFYGGAGDDSLMGNDGNDTISGETGSDSVDGGAGDDSLDGGDGGDSVSGGAGDDVLGDGMGDDTLDGGSGNDIFNLTPGSDDDVRDSLGTNTLSFAGAARGLTIDLGLATGQRQTVDVARNTVSLRGVFHHVIGSAFADDLTGNEQPNRLEGGEGDDVLDGGGGDRSLRGQSSGRAPDRRSGAGCDGDTLVGQTGHDWLDGGRGRDRLDGGDGDDVLVGDAARDTLSGGGGANREIRVTKSSARCAASGGRQARGRGGRGGAAVGNGLPSPIQFDPVAGLLQVQGDGAGPLERSGR